MAETNKMDRTWLCSVLFMDIANYSSQSVGLQMKWKQRFNTYLAEAIQDVPEGDRVILDTGDGAAVCFLGAPEVAMFKSLELCRSFAVDEREQQPGLRVRLGINLGPVKLVKDINGALNAIGDGINAGQRIMSFAQANQILVSQSFYEVVSCLDDDYKLLFQLKGVETDKHVREHTVYHLASPGSEKREPTVANPDGQAITAKPVPKIGVAPTPGPAAATGGTAPSARASKSGWAPWLVAGIAVAAAAVVVVMRFSGSPAPPPTVVNAQPAAQAQNSAQISVPTPASPSVPAAPKPATGTADANAAKPEPQATAPAETAPAAAPQDVKAGRKGERKAALAAASSTAASPEAKAAYDEGMRLVGENKAAEAIRHFDDAVRAQPDYIESYVGRAEARRLLEQWELSLPDCNKIIQLNADDPRGYNCRGFARQMLKQPDAALTDFDQAIRLNPNFIIAYEHRGTTYTLLRQYDRAVQDYTQAIRLAPRNPLFLARRGEAYSNLKQYDKAIRDFTEAIRLQPNDKNAYRLRAMAEQASGDTAGAAADREQMKEAQGKKKKM